MNPTPFDQVRPGNRRVAFSLKPIDNEAYVQDFKRHHS